MRIVLASGDTDLRLAIQLMLSEEPGYGFIGSANNSAGLLALIKSVWPDWVLMDWLIVDANKQEFWSEIISLKSESNMRVIVLGRQENLREAATQAGADAFVVIGDPPEHLLEALSKLKFSEPDSK